MLFRTLELKWRIGSEAIPTTKWFKLVADDSSPSNDVDIDILIGADFYWNFVSNESRRGEQPGPVALLTRLGWVLSGPIDNYCEEVRSTTNFAATHVLRVNATTVQCKMYRTPT